MAATGAKTRVKREASPLGAHVRLVGAVKDIHFKIRFAWKDWRSMASFRVSGVSSLGMPWALALVRLPSTQPHQASLDVLRA